MSLTQHLHRDGPLTQWMRGYAWHGLTQQVSACADHTSSGPRHESIEAYAEVGGIVGRRVEQTLEPAPPYVALAAAVNRGTVTAQQAGELAAFYPTHTDTAPAQALVTRPSPGGPITIGNPPRGDASSLQGRAQLAHVIAADAAETPLGNADAERLHAARVLAALDGEYRSGGVVDSHTDRLLSGHVSDGVLSDAQQLERSSGPLVRQLSALCTDGYPTGHAAPSLVPQWADGDVLAGPTTASGYALLDVKTVGKTSLRREDRVQTWLWQIVAYAALDTADTWQIHAVGLVLPRQARVLVWSLADIRQALGITPHGWRELQRVLGAAYAQDSGGVVPMR